jgi:hypothetical protein
VEEFQNLTDQELKLKIKRVRSLCGLHRLPDGGKKLREYACRLENEHDRRHGVGPRKVRKMQIFGVWFLYGFLDLLPYAGLGKKRRKDFQLLLATY